MARPRDRHLRRELEARAVKEIYQKLRRRYEVDRLDLQAAWDKLALKLHKVLTDYRAVAPGILVSGLRLLRGQSKRRGHGMQYLGERALGSVGVHAWTYWRAKRVALADGWLYRFEEGGGRLAKSAGGGHGDDGHWIGKADGVVPGPHVTGWDEARYRRLMVQPPPAPEVREVDPEDVGAASIGQEFTSNRQLLHAIEYRTRPPT